ncbi:MAG TPA: hypothetical protein VHB79_37650 [Polyangiaceae bacterium]|nr:hypothetical protein [Polyangiaceae bacterium]
MADSTFGGEKVFKVLALVLLANLAAVRSSSRSASSSPVERRRA